MVDHARKQLRDAAMTDLAGLTTTGSNVFTGRVSPLAGSEVPGWIVRMHEEEAAFGAIGTLERTGNLILEGVVQGTGMEEMADTMAAEAEAAIYAAESAVNALAMRLGAPMTAIELPEPMEGQALGTGRVRLLIPVVYRTEIGVPTVIV